jgi:ABC-type Na+ transport system ATPase subunit NatA
MALVHHCERETAVDTLAVEQNGAGATLTMVATLLRPRQGETLAEKVE